MVSRIKIRFNYFYYDLYLVYKLIQWKESEAKKTFLAECSELADGATKQKTKLTQFLLCVECKINIHYRPEQMKVISVRVDLLQLNEWRLLFV